MLSPQAVEALAHDFIELRRAEAAHAQLIAQLPRTPHTLPFVAARSRVARALRTVAGRLDPTLVVVESARAAASADARVLIARSH